MTLSPRLWRGHNAPCDSTLHRDLPTNEIHVIPSQGQDLPKTKPGSHRKQDHRLPLSICGRHQSTRFIEMKKVECRGQCLEPLDSRPSRGGVPAVLVACALHKSLRRTWADRRHPHAVVRRDRWCCRLDFRARNSSSSVRAATWCPQANEFRASRSILGSLVRTDRDVRGRAE